MFLNITCLGIMQSVIKCLAEWTLPPHQFNLGIYRKVIREEGEELLFFFILINICHWKKQKKKLKQYIHTYIYIALWKLLILIQFNIYIFVPPSQSIFYISNKRRPIILSISFSSRTIFPLFISFFGLFSIDLNTISFVNLSM